MTFTDNNTCKYDGLDDNLIKFYCEYNDKFIGYEADLDPIKNYKAYNLPLRCVKKAKQIGKTFGFWIWFIFMILMIVLNLVGAILAKNKIILFKEKDLYSLYTFYENLKKIKFIHFLN